VLKSASNNWEKVGEKGRSLVMTKRGAMDTIRSRLFGSNALVVWNRDRLKYSCVHLCTSVFELPHGRRWARFETTTWGRERSEGEDGDVTRESQCLPS
jgi:hypothetical protein